MNTLSATKLASLSIVALVLTGCAHQHLQPTEADGTYCHRPGNSLSTSKTCTPAAVPSVDAEAKARQFASVPGAAVLYVVRNRWEDSHHRLPVTVDGRPAVVTVPVSVTRVVLAPGQHTVALEWQGKRAEVKVSANAGEVVFVEVEGSTPTWGATFGWYAPDAQRSRQRASMAKLIADLDWRS